ncbi:prepilin peptidase [bacterium]|nr:prepilin peptidase [bacterium]
MWFVIITVSLVAAIFDVRQRRIPNLVTFPVLAGGLIWNAYWGGLAAMGAALTAALLLTLPYVLLFAAGLGGAGDAKLMGALGAWVGTPLGYYLLGCVAATGAVLGLGYAIVRGRGRRTFGNLGRMLMWVPWLMGGPGSLRERTAILPSSGAMTRMPYGVAVFVGSCLTAVGVGLWG